MGKIGQTNLSLKWSFLAVYLPLCCLLSFLGTLGIAFGTNALQDFYITSLEKTMSDPNKNLFYFIISNAQFLLIPLWILGCVALTGLIFYHRELKKPISLLLYASKKISDNELDFTIGYKKQNELGQLCSAFEEMRQSLEKNNREMWRSLDERKRLNSAFSHDLRTPLTVLRGYQEFLEEYIPLGKIPEEKLMSVLSMMGGQIRRLEQYTDKMGALHRLEDIRPDISEISAGELRDCLRQSASFIRGEKLFDFHFYSDKEQLRTDVSLITEVFENLISNSARYAESKITANAAITDGKLTVTVTDDGPGFPVESLALVPEPFYRGDSEPDSAHLGLGLYICRVICTKFDGDLSVSNTQDGSRVTAEFILES